MSAACAVCQGRSLTPLIDVGPQPISNRFLQSPGDPEERFAIALQQCDACGLIQIEAPVPASALVPPYDWITYNEPEGHLDDLQGGVPRVDLAPAALEEAREMGRQRLAHQREHRVRLVAGLRHREVGVLRHERRVQA